MQTAFESGNRLVGVPGLENEDEMWKGEECWARTLERGRISACLAHH